MTACKFCGKTFKEAEDEDYSPYYDHLEDCRKQKIALEEKGDWAVRFKPDFIKSEPIESETVASETADVQ